MKNYKVKATRYFRDLEEQKDRFIDDEFMCTKERYEFLKSKNGAVELVEVGEEVAKKNVEERENEELKEKPKRKSNKK